jgi:hypothetical protein
MPAKGTSKISKRQKAAVAMARAAGKPLTAIAKEVGISHSAAAKLAVGDEVKGIVNRIIAADEPRIAGLFNRVLASLEADMDPAGQSTFDQRERARNQAVAVLQLGQPRIPDAPAGGASTGALPGGGVLLGDMLTVYRTAVLGATAPPEQP